MGGEVIVRHLPGKDLKVSESEMERRLYDRRLATMEAKVGDMGATLVRIETLMEAEAKRHIAMDRGIGRLRENMHTVVSRISAMEMLLEQQESMRDDIEELKLSHAANTAVAQARKDGQWGIRAFLTAVITASVGAVVGLVNYVMGGGHNG